MFIVPGVAKPLASTQSATVYINIHGAAIVSAREKRRNGWLFCLLVSIRLFSKKAQGFMNACGAHMSMLEGACLSKALNFSR